MDRSESGRAPNGHGTDANVLTEGLRRLLTNSDGLRKGVPPAPESAEYASPEGGFAMNRFEHGSGEGETTRVWAGNGEVG
jgi:hypothetical protein